MATTPAPPGATAVRTAGGDRRQWAPHKETEMSTTTTQTTTAAQWAARADLARAIARAPFGVERRIAAFGCAGGLFWASPPARRRLGSGYSADSYVSRLRYEEQCCLEAAALLNRADAVIRPVLLEALGLAGPLEGFGVVAPTGHDPEVDRLSHEEGREARDYRADRAEELAWRHTPASLLPQSIERARIPLAARERAWARSTAAAVELALHGHRHLDPALSRGLVWRERVARALDLGLLRAARRLVEVAEADDAALDAA